MVRDDGVPDSKREPLLTGAEEAAELYPHRAHSGQQQLHVPISDCDAGCGRGERPTGAGGRSLAPSSNEGLDLPALLRLGQSNVLDYLEEKGVQKLGDMQVVDSVMIKALGDRSMLTTGSQRMREGLDWEAMWRKQLRLHSKDDKATEGWNKTIRAEAYVVSIRGCVLSGPTGLLHPILQHFRAGACSRAVFGLPAVQALVNFKWDHFARTLLLYNMALYAVWLLAFTGFVLIFRDEDDEKSLLQLLQSPYGRLEVGLEFLALLAMLPFVLMEATNIWAYSWRWFSFEKLLTSAGYVNQVAITLVHLTRLGSGTEIMGALLASQYILLWFRFQASFRVFRPTSTTFADTLKEVVSEIKWYIVFLCVTVWSFAVAFHVLLRYDHNKDQEDYEVMTSSFLATLNMMASGTQWKPFYESDNSAAASCMFVLFVITMPLILLTQFISLMTLTMGKMREQEGLRFLMHKAMTIDELETGLPNWLINALPASCWPAFIHVLKVDHASVHTIALDECWTQVGINGSASIINTNDEMNIRLRRMEQVLLQISKQLNQKRASDGDETDKIEVHDESRMPLDAY